MKPLRIFLLLAGLLLASSRAEAQFSISKVTPKEADVKNFRDTIKQLSAVNNQFFSEARYRAEKKRLRKERNTITASLLYTHVYTRDKLNMTYSFDSKYGMNVISGTTFKNLDYFIFNLNTGWAISKNWSYSASANLRSQWSKGYKSVTEKILVSNFMSPGTLTLGVGFTYRALKKVPLIVTVNPLSGNMQFVLDDSLSRQGAHGVPAGKHQKSSLGSTLRIDLSQPIAGGKMNYITYFYVSTNYEQNNYVEWQNTFNIIAAKIFNIGLFCRMVYNEPQATPRNRSLQWTYKIGVGLSYTFKNK